MAVQGFAAAQRKWEDFQQINPHPEYNEAVQAVLDIALKLQPGQPAPEFTLPNLDDQPVSLSQFKGQVVLLDFWASWCVPCINDLPYLRQVKEKTADWPVVFLNISLDADEAAWREAIDKHEIKGVHVRADGWNAEVAKTYQVEWHTFVLLGGLPRADRGGFWFKGEYRRDCSGNREELVRSRFKINTVLTTRTSNGRSDLRRKVMRYMFLAILLMAAPRGAVALTWDFADGSTWGWTAWESNYSNVRGSREPLHSEIVDGVWRIAPVPVADPPFNCARR